MNGAAEMRNAIVLAENRRAVRTRLVDISSSLCWSGHYTVSKCELKCAQIHAPEERAYPLRLVTTHGVRYVFFRLSA
jgi:hypothetical protein